MKKTLLILVSSFFIISIMAQEKQYQYKIEKGRLLFDVSINEKGNVFILTSLNKRMSLKKQKPKLTKLNSNLEVIFSKEFDIPGFIFNTFGKLKYSKNGEFTRINSDAGSSFSNGPIWMVDEIGGIKKYGFDYNELDGNLISKGYGMKLFSNEFYTVIGTKEGRENYKKEYNASDYYIFSRKHSDYTTTEKKFVYPALELPTESKMITFDFEGAYTDYFMLGMKGDINKERNIDAYHVVKYKYNGDYLSHVSLPIVLDNKYLTLSKNSGVTTYFDKNYGSFAVNNLLINEESGDYFVFGMYTNKPKRKMLSANYKGFYIYKYNKSGVKEWEKFFSLSKYKIFNANYLATRLGIYARNLYNGNIAIYVSLDDKQHIISVIDYEGELKKQDNIETKDAKILNSGYTHHQEMYLYARYKLKDSKLKKKYFNFSTIAAYHINPSVRKFILSKNPNEKLYYQSEFVYDGIILSEFDLANKIINIYKFK